jgi:hypothetical protein
VVAFDDFDAQLGRLPVQADPQPPGPGVGRDRYRSMTPLARSLCSPYAVVVELKTANWARIPGMS